MRNTSLRSLILLFALGITWGSGYSIAKYATTNGISPLAYAFWQSLGPAILVSVVALLIHRRWILSLSYWRYYLVCGLLGIAIPNTNMYFTAAHLPAGLLAIIVNIAPILTYIIALFVKQEKFHLLRMSGVVCGMLGILCILLPQVVMPTKHEFFWLLQTLLSPLCFSLCAVFIAKYYPPHEDSLSLAAGMLICSSILLAPLVFSHHVFYWLKPWASFPDTMVMVEIILSSLGYVLMFLLLKHAGPVYYSLVAGVVVITGIFWGGKIFHEVLSFWEALAMGLIFLGISLVSTENAA
ncbi:MAG: hypothetical protein K0S08_1798 [Gammaproteobacteria bacterium]|jgi:drug/metabolite transporter (DMT)-like permease|nr:hypothetical protein [Gammaproteobacteria bacterium]